MLAMNLSISCAWADWSWVVPSDYASISPDLFLKGVKEADSFRRNLLQKNAVGLTKADVLSEAIARFQRLAGDYLSKENGVKGYKIRKKNAPARIQGRKIKIKTS